MRAKDLKIPDEEELETIEADYVHFEAGGITTDDPYDTRQFSGKPKRS